MRGGRRALLWAAGALALAGHLGLHHRGHHLGAAHIAEMRSGGPGELIAPQAAGSTGARLEALAATAQREEAAAGDASGGGPRRRRKRVRGEPAGPSEEEEGKDRLGTEAAAALPPPNADAEPATDRNRARAAEGVAAAGRRARVPWYERLPAAWNFTTPRAENASSLAGKTFLLNRGQFAYTGGNGTAPQRQFLDFGVDFKLWGNKDLHHGQKCHDPADPDNAPHTNDPRVEQCLVRYRFHEDTVRALPPRDRRPHFGTCAVVGNSGTLLGSKFGGAIDAHDAVIRLNGAPTAGFEDDVGQKTTWDMVNKPNLVRLEKEEGLAERYGKGTDAALMIFETIRWRPYYKLVPKVLNAIGKEHLLVLSPDFVQAAADVWWTLMYHTVTHSNKHYGVIIRPDGTCAKREGGAFGRSKSVRWIEAEGGTATCGRPLSGWFATAVAAHVCDAVDIYGFDSYARRRGVRGVEENHLYHYFDTVQGHTQTHSFSLAEEVTKRFLERSLGEGKWRWVSPGGAMGR